MHNTTDLKLIKVDGSKIDKELLKGDDNATTAAIAMPAGGARNAAIAAALADNIKYDPLNPAD